MNRLKLFALNAYWKPNVVICNIQVIFIRTKAEHIFDKSRNGAKHPFPSFSTILILLSTA